MIKRLLRLVGRWARKPVNHTSWVAVVTPTDRPKSVRNRCLIELFCGVVCVVTLPFWHFCWCRGFCHRTESDLFLFLLRINVDLAIFQPYIDLEAGINQSMKMQVARPGIEPRSSCSASQELKHSATAAPILKFENKFLNILKIDNKELQEQIILFIHQSNKHRIWKKSFYTVFMKRVARAFSEGILMDTVWNGDYDKMMYQT